MDVVYKLEIVPSVDEKKYIKYFSSLNKVKKDIDLFCAEIDLVVLWSWKKHMAENSTHHDIVHHLDGEIYSVDEELTMYEIFCTKILVN